MAIRPTDPEKKKERIRQLREWQQRSVKNYRETVKEETLAGERTSKLGRSTRINPVNSKRRKKEHRRTYGSTERVQAIKALPCTVPHCKRTPCDNAHITGGGMGRKSDWDQIVPLCSGPNGHHAELDDYHGSVEEFDRFFGTDLRATAERLAREYPVDDSEEAA